VQDRAPQGCGARDLREREAQAETGLMARIVRIAKDRRNCEIDGIPNFWHSWQFWQLTV
jgi:hypothetical protein